MGKKKAEGIVTIRKTMKRNVIKKTIIMYEFFAFMFVIATLWIDEVFDLPYHLLGAVKTPINWVESIAETILVLCLCLFTIHMSKRFLQRIKYLEGFLRVCTFCKKICIENNWIPVDTYILNNSETTLSHGLCPECLEKHYGITSED